jgi:diguanylate cyclase (GGDEF)-like protein
LKNELGETVGFRCVGRDVTERKQMEQKLAEMATHDFLTGLPNRFLLTDRFSIAAAQAHRKDAKMALLLLDLDKFKSVNDALGHSVGDKLLQAIGERLSGIIRSSDTVARLGGDEFLLLLPEIVNLDDAEKIAKKIVDAFNEPFIINGNSLRISISAGIAIYPEDGTDLEVLMQKSDLDMYRGKKSDRSR